MQLEFTGSPCRVPTATAFHPYAEPNPGRSHGCDHGCFFEPASARWAQPARLQVLTRHSCYRPQPACSGTTPPVAYIQKSELAPAPPESPPPKWTSELPPC